MVPKDAGTKGWLFGILSASFHAVLKASWSVYCLIN